MMDVNPNETTGQKVKDKIAMLERAVAAAEDAARSAERPPSQRFRSGWTNMPREPRPQTFAPMTMAGKERLGSTGDYTRVGAEQSRAKKEAEDETARELGTKKQVKEESERKKIVEINKLLDDELQAKRAELSRLEAELLDKEILVKRERLDKLEQERVEREKKIAEERKGSDSDAVSTLTPLPVPTDTLDSAEEGMATGVLTQSTSAVVEEERDADTNPEKKMWQRKDCRFASSLLLLILIGGAVGVALSISAVDDTPVVLATVSRNDTDAPTIAPVDALAQVARPGALQVDSSTARPDDLCGLLALTDDELYEMASSSKIGTHCYVKKGGADAACSYYVKGRPRGGSGYDGVPLTSGQFLGTGCVVSGRGGCYYYDERYPLTDEERDSMCGATRIGNAAAQLRYGIRNGYCTDDPDQRCNDRPPTLPPTLFPTLKTEEHYTCEYVKRQDVAVSAVPNFSSQEHYGGTSDFDKDTAVVTARDQALDFYGAGAVWIISKKNGIWEQTKVIQTSETERFGWSPSIKGNTIVVGAPGYGGSTVLDNQLNTYWEGRGRAIVMKRDNNGAWNEQAILSPEVTSSNGNAGFGISVGIADCECRMVIGADGDRDTRGSVYVFETNISGTWNQVQKLFPKNARKSGGTLGRGNYGYTVAISNDLLAVRAPYDYIGSVRGVVYIYQRLPNGTWDEIQQLSTPEGPEIPTHGNNISFLGEYLLVGSPGNNKVYVFKQTVGGSGYQKNAELLGKEDGDDDFLGLGYGYSDIFGTGNTFLGTTSNHFGNTLDGEGDNVMIGDVSYGSYLYSLEDGMWKERATFQGGLASMSGDSIVVHDPLSFGMDALYTSYVGVVSFYDLVC